MEPQDLNLSVLLSYGTFNHRDDLQKTPVFNTEAEELDFEDFETCALVEGIGEVIEEVILHFGLVSVVLLFEVTIAKTLHVELLDVLWLDGNGKAFYVLFEDFEATGLKEARILLKFLDLDFFFLHNNILSKTESICG